MSSAKDTHRTLTSGESCMVTQALREKAAQDRERKTKLLQELEAIPRDVPLTQSYQRLAETFETQARDAELLAELIDGADDVVLVSEVAHV